MSIALFIRKALTVQVIALSLALLYLAAAFVMDIPQDVAQKLIALCVASIALTIAHIWISDSKLIPGKSALRIVYSILGFEYIASTIILFLLAFGLTPWIKTAVVLLALQLMHLAFYSLNWFFFDERSSSSHKNLSAQDIATMELGSQEALPPRLQSSNNEH